MNRLRKRVATVIMVATLLLGAIYSWWQVGQQPESVTASISLPPAPTITARQIDQVLPQDAIQAIDRPRFEAVAEAETQLRPEERVLGVEINGEARAYPIAILSVHEVVNDEIGGVPVAITWCPLCYTAFIFSRSIDGHAEPLSFGVSGKLLYNTLVMYDRQTESLWSQLYGSAVSGPLAGRSLAVYPSLHTTWKEWKKRYPEGDVLSKRLTCQQFDCGTYSENPRGSYLVDPYLSYYQMPDEGVVDAQIPRETNVSGRKQRVFGVRLGTASRAYTYELLREEPLINDTLNGLPVVVWFEATSDTGAAFGRVVEGQVLTMRLDQATPEFMVDEETNSRWQASSGRAIAGPLAGSQLPPLVTTSAFAFGWEAYFPDGEIRDSGLEIN